MSFLRWAAREAVSHLLGHLCPPPRPQIDVQEIMRRLAELGEQKAALELLAVTEEARADQAEYERGAALNSGKMFRKIAYEFMGLRDAAEHDAAILAHNARQRARLSRHAFAARARLARIAHQRGDETARLRLDLQAAEVAIASERERADKAERSLSELERRIEKLQIEWECKR